MIKKIIIPVLLLAALNLPQQAGAWGLLGHRVVAQIAETYLTKTAKKEIQKILGNETMAMSANWPDFIKSDSTMKMYDPWHYVNLESGLSADSVHRYLQTASAPNIYNRINVLVAELKRGNLSQDQKAFDLKFLIHLIGDLHQPMHVGQLSDRGGNSIKLKWFGNSTNLHRIWDEDLISFQDLSYTEYAHAINFTTRQQREALQAIPLEDWVYRSYLLAQKIYADITEPDQKINPYNYNYKYQAILNNQLLEGSVHLAGLLNSIFK